MLVRGVRESVEAAPVLEKQVARGLTNRMGWIKRRRETCCIYLYLWF
jgi:hypothetical protein